MQTNETLVLQQQAERKKRIPQRTQEVLRKMIRRREIELCISAPSHTAFPRETLSSPERVRQLKPMASQHQAIFSE